MSKLLELLTLEMRLVYLIATGIVLLTAAAHAQQYPCLPADIQHDTIVRYVRDAPEAKARSVKAVTVQETLKLLKAKCSRGTLVDGTRRPIYFFKLEGCWGNPPSDHLEILERQRKTLQRLRSQYTVIEITCDLSGLPRWSVSFLHKQTQYCRPSTATV